MVVRKPYFERILLSLAGFFAVVPVVSGQTPASQVATSPQAANEDLSFEVVTIKPSAPTMEADGMESDGHRFTIRNGRVAYLMTYAYDLPPKQIVGGPAWLRTDKYDIVAVTPGKSDAQQVKGMVRRLLAERFGLSFHREKRTVAVYALLVEKAGPKMEKSMAETDRGSGFRGRGMGQLTVTNGSMADFARWLNGGVLDRPVIDQTGLTGKFNFTLNWMPDESQYGGMGMRMPSTDSANALPSFFTAIKEQIGLKMDATKADVDVLVIDHVEKPTEN
jgi:uncharacterized protein (TIGR03435 family)